MRALVVVLAVAGCGSSNSATVDGHSGDGGDDDGAPPTDADTTDAPPDPCAPGQWCIETAPVAATLLHAVWAANPDDVFAVGDNGAIFRRHHNVWTAMDSTTTQNLRGVWGTSASDVWAVGTAGTVLRFDGTTWAPTGNVTIDLDAVWGSSANDVWLSGFGQINHWNGSMFDSHTLSNELLAISGTGPDDVWVTGENALVDHFTGTWTTGIDPGAGTTYFAIVAIAPGDIWIATSTPNKQTLEFTGGTWTPHAATGTTFQSFYAVSGTDLWAAGGTKVGHWAGSSWALDTPGGLSVQLFGAGGSGSSVWVVGTGSTILHRR